MTVISFIAVISDVAVLAKIVSSPLMTPSAKFDKKQFQKQEQKLPFVVFVDLDNTKAFNNVAALIYI